MTRRWSLTLATVTVGLFAVAGWAGRVGGLLADRINRSTR